MAGNEHSRYAESKHPPDKTQDPLKVRKAVMSVRQSKSPHHIIVQTVYRTDRFQ